MRGWPATVRVAAALSLVGGVVVAHQASAWDTNPLKKAYVASHYLCGRDDLPEGAISGDIPKADQDSGRAQKGYNCGLALVGHTQLTTDVHGNTRAAGNANMAWASHCAYIAGSAGVSVAPQSAPKPPANAGVAIVSVTPAGKPTFIGTLRNPGALATAETINAVTTPSGRSILVVGQYGNDVVSQPKPMDVYDVTRCDHPKHIANPQYPNDPTKATYYWPGNIHNLTLSRDGRYVFGTIPLQAADISPLFQKKPQPARYVGNLEKAIAALPSTVGPVGDFSGVTAPVRAQTHPENSSHEAWPSADGNTLYVGGSTAEFETFTILDIKKWLLGQGPARVISQVSGRGHSVRTGTIHGVPYVLHSEESVFGAAYGCIPQEGAPFAGPAQPWLTDISDPAHPKTVSQMGLGINDPKNCAEQLQAKENDSVHYHDVDNPNDTTFVMASMWNAGLRVFDVRNPNHPTEVAYFNPGDVDPTSAVKLDQAWGHVRFLPKLGQIWFETEWGGFYVVRIEGQVWHYLGLDAKNKALHLPPNPPDTHTVKDSGWPGTLGSLVARPKAGWIDISPFYCTLAAQTAPVSNALSP
ncbi:MAG TPA: hypothetical protein VHE83_07265 [Mycobacteriales bacterium]|nr:hypothetical protein [Mycobacteriales bacterium]